MSIVYKKNPQFTVDLKRYLEGKLELVALKLAEESKKVIETERFWEGWTVTNPFRDIVDTKDLSNSMVVERISQTTYRIRWNTDYVTFVYFGFTMQNGRVIPPRKWVELAIAENDWSELLKENISIVIKTNH